MKRVFITGSTTGLGLLAGKLLLEKGHHVVLHARNEHSAQEARNQLKQDVPFVIGDISDLTQMKSVVEQVNTLGPLDSIIHNAGVYERHSEQFTKEGLRTMFAVNVLAPFVISALLPRPERMVFMSSGMHLDGKFDLKDPQWKTRPWNSTEAYCDSKLYDLMLTKWFARKWPETFINAVNPGWVPTRMGGAGAPDDLTKGAETQVWLSVSSEPGAFVTGKYFHHMKQHHSNPEADSKEAQDDLVSYLEEISCVKWF